MTGRGKEEGKEIRRYISPVLGPALIQSMEGGSKSWGLPPL